MFERVMLGISSGVIKLVYGGVRVIFDQRAKATDLKILKAAKEYFRDDYELRFDNWYPVAFFAWKLLDITEIEEPKNPTYLQSLESAINTFYGDLEMAQARQAGGYSLHCCVFNWAHHAT